MHALCCFVSWISLWFVENKDTLETFSIFNMGSKLQCLPVVHFSLILAWLMVVFVCIMVFNSLVCLCTKKVVCVCVCACMCGCMCAFVFILSYCLDNCMQKICYLILYIQQMSVYLCFCKCAVCVCTYKHLYMCSEKFISIDIYVCAWMCLSVFLYTKIVNNRVWKKCFFFIYPPPQFFFLVGHAANQYFCVVNKPHIVLLKESENQSCKIVCDCL